MTCASHNTKLRPEELLRENTRLCEKTLGQTLGSFDRDKLEHLTYCFQFSIKAGDLQVLDGHLYVTHTGLIRLAHRKKCRAIHVEAVDWLCDGANKRYVLKATVFPSNVSSGFIGFGDADPTNVSELVRGAEIRIAETRAVNRALRKAYGVGACSLEELGFSANRTELSGERKRPVNENGCDRPKVRDRLCQIIRQYQLNASLVKSYATDFCGITTLRDASREQVESFIAHLAAWAEKDRNALQCQLDSYLGQKESAA